MCALHMHCTKVRRQACQNYSSSRLQYYSIMKTIQIRNNSNMKTFQIWYKSQASSLPELFVVTAAKLFKYENYSNMKTFKIWYKCQASSLPELTTYVCYKFQFSNMLILLSLFIRSESSPSIQPPICSFCICVCICEYIHKSRISHTHRYIHCIHTYIHVLLYLHMYMQIHA